MWKRNLGYGNRKRLGGGDDHGGGRRRRWGTVPNPGMPYWKVDGCGDAVPVDDGPATVTQGKGGVGAAPTTRGENGGVGRPPAEVRTSTSASRDENWLIWRCNP